MLHRSITEIYKMYNFKNFASKGIIIFDLCIILLFEQK